MIAHKVLCKRLSGLKNRSRVTAGLLALGRLSNKRSCKHQSSSKFQVLT